MKLVILATMFLATFCAFAEAQSYTERTAANGVVYSTPDDWTPVTLNQLVRYSEITPDFLDALEDQVPGVTQDYEEQTRIFILNWLDEDGAQLGMLTFSIVPVRPDEAVTQSEFQAVQQSELSELLEIFRADGQQMASLILSSGQDIYDDVVYVDAGVSDFGAWRCFVQYLETVMKNGHQPYYIPISCPAGRVSLQFNFYVERHLVDEAWIVLDRVIANVDVSSISKGGVTTAEN